MNNSRYTKTLPSTKIILRDQTEECPLCKVWSNIPEQSSKLILELGWKLAEWHKLGSDDTPQVRQYNLGSDNTTLGQMIQPYREWTLTVPVVLGFVLIPICTDAESVKCLQSGEILTLHSFDLMCVAPFLKFLNFIIGFHVVKRVQVVNICQVIHLHHSAKIIV